MSGLFHVYFDGSNWVGVILEDNEESVKSGKYIFGSEPTPTEIFEWAKKGCPGLVLRTVPKTGQIGSNPQNGSQTKRMLKELKRAEENRPIGSYAQEVLRKATELRKKAASLTNKERRAQKAVERYEKRLLKKKKKKRGH